MNINSLSYNTDLITRFLCASDSRVLVDPTAVPADTSEDTCKESISLQNRGGGKRKWMKNASLHYTSSLACQYAKRKVNNKIKNEVTCVVAVLSAIRGDSVLVPDASAILLDEGTSQIVL